MFWSWPSTGSKPDVCRTSLPAFKAKRGSWRSKQNWCLGLKCRVAGGELRLDFRQRGAATLGCASLPGATAGGCCEGWGAACLRRQLLSLCSLPGLCCLHCKLNELLMDGRWGLLVLGNNGQFGVQTALLCLSLQEAPDKRGCGEELTWIHVYGIPSARSPCQDPRQNTPPVSGPIKQINVLGFLFVCLFEIKM